MRWSYRPRTRRYDTPIGDMLDSVTRWEPMPTWNRDRQPGGEWDYIRSLPIKTRRRLTSAGYMAKHGMQPDKFADMIREYAPGMRNLSDGECHAWYVKHALLALAERRRAQHYDRHLAYARHLGHPTYYALRRARGSSDHRVAV